MGNKIESTFSRKEKKKNNFFFFFFTVCVCVVRSVTEKRKSTRQSGPTLPLHARTKSTHMTHMTHTTRTCRSDALQSASSKTWIFENPKKSYKKSESKSTSCIESRKVKYFGTLQCWTKKRHFEFQDNPQLRPQSVYAQSGKSPNEALSFCPVKN